MTTRIEELTELEMFRMAVTLTGHSMSEDRLAGLINVKDFITDRIMECHASILRSANQLLGKDSPSGAEH